MDSHAWVKALCFGWLLYVVLPAAHAYVLQGQRWPDDQPIVMDLQLGSPAQTLIDGSTSWNDVAEAALSIWNPYLNSGVQFQANTNTVIPKEGDGVNSVLFSNTIYGEDFGDDTLAITISLYDPSTNIKTEADVLFNSAQPFDSYRGNLRTDSDGSDVYDLRRVAIHEFGHVLGLAHVAQSVVAIMTPVITKLDTIQTDDIAGVEAIYGGVAAAPVITSALDLNAGIGQAINYRITASNSPAGYQASGLPSGLSFSASTGLITGMVTATGIYEIVVSATNANGTGRATVILTVSTLPVITSSLSVSAELGKPFGYLITASPQATSFTANGLPSGLTIDTSIGLISGIPTVVGNYNTSISASNGAGTGTAVLHLNSLFDIDAASIYNFSGPDGSAPSAGLILASDGNLYGTTSGGGANDEGTIFRLTPDGTLTTIHSFAGPDGANPVAELFQANDGNFYGTTQYGGAGFTSKFVNGYGSVFQCRPDGTVTMLHSFSYDNVVGAFPTSALAQGADGNLYGSTNITAGTDDNEGTIFRITLNGVLTVAYSYIGTNLNHASALTLGTDGNLYGATAYGGTGGALGYGMGTIFKIAPDGSYTTLYTFDGITAGSPSSRLIQAADGNFYGTAADSDFNGPGVVYRITPAGEFNILHSFAIYTGGPSALVQGVDGNFYGTTGNYGSSIDGNNYDGTIYKMTPDGTVTTLHYFDIADGTAFSGLVQGADGEFYGTASTLGDLESSGTIFKTSLISDPRNLTLPTVSLEAAAPVVVAGSGGVGKFVLILSAVQTNDVIVNYTIKGSAINGEDYVLLNGTKKIKAGKQSKSINIAPLGNLGGLSKKTVKLVVEPGTGYAVGTAGKAKVAILAAQQ